MKFSTKHALAIVFILGWPTLRVLANPSVNYEYDAYGNCTAITNELAKGAPTPMTNIAAAPPTPNH